VTIPDHFTPETLDEVRADVFARLARAVKDRRSPMHTPVIATRGIDGATKARVVVLRAFDSEAVTLRFHTDLRAKKIAELNADPHIAFAFYDHQARIQIRAEGMASIHSDDALEEMAWNASLRMSRVCYGVKPAPGAPLDGADDFTLPDDDGAIAAGRANFSAVLCRIEALEYLFLRHAGHRRARFTRMADGWSGQWLAP
jgi:pyridoxine/pyridoxamine 5'-phosphate oxidase